MTEVFCQIVIGHEAAHEGEHHEEQPGAQGGKKAENLVFPGAEPEQHPQAATVNVVKGISPTTSKTLAQPGLKAMAIEISKSVR